MRPFQKGSLFYTAVSKRCLMSLTISEILSQLSKDDERLLISLPYRAGLYVSFADTTGGWQAQDREIQS